MNYLQLLLPYAPYALLAMLIMGPMLLPGFVLTMDMVFAPNIALPSHVDNTWPMYALLHMLDLLLPADVVQKLLLLTCLLLSGMGMHRLLLLVGPADRPLWRWAIYVGATLYMVNPFVYDRLMAGQWGVWLSYALLPWFAASLWAVVRSPTGRQAVRVGLWLTGLSVASAHAVGYAMILVLVALALGIWYRQDLRQWLVCGAIALGVFVALSAYWLLPTMIGQGRVAQSLATFTPAGQQAFATVDAVGTTSVGAVAGLLGFWQETKQLYLQPIQSYPLWGFVYVALLLSMIWGGIVAWRHSHRLSVYVVLVAVVAIVLAVGAGVWLSAGYREPQKFVALLALCYAYFAAWGAWWALTRVRWRKLTLALLLFLIAAYTPTLFVGAAGQLRPTNYPADWFAVDKMIKGHKVLALPWHLYMSYGFTNGRIIASPHPKFFSASVVHSDDPELPGVAPQTPDSQRQFVQEQLLPAGLRGEPVAQKLRDAGISHILLSKDLDWQRYAPITSQAQLVYDGTSLQLYRLTE